MATYNFSISAKSRGKGKSAAAELSYNSRSKLYDPTTGRNFDNREKKDLVWSDVFLPAGAAEEWNDLQSLASALEEYSTSANARICKTFIAALPNELSEESKIALAQELGEHFKRQGIVAAICFHDETKKEKRNCHLHVAISTKPCKDGKFVPGSMAGYKCIHKGVEKILTAKEFNALKETSAPPEKIYRYVPKDEEPTAANTLRLTPSQFEAEYKETHVRKSKQPEKIKIDLTDWDSKEWLKEQRTFWAAACNRFLELEGFEERVSEKSYKDLGIEKVPEVHLGTVAAEMERKNPGSTVKGQQNLSVRKRNEGIEHINNLLANNIIEDEVDRAAAQEIKKELLEDDEAELMESTGWPQKVFGEIVGRLEEARARFCAYVFKENGFVLFLRNQLATVQRVLGRFAQRSEGLEDVLAAAQERSRETDRTELADIEGLDK